ncbi:MAG: hypothetical protein LBE27_00355 [Deltaproteobacteria bacterium]|jgi:hypothetical protein|nr:hypothetical protein [Deltaproteobacteria bacterium]
MAYYTTVMVVNSDGRPVKAEVHCGGTYRGFTDEVTGELTFTMSTKDIYSVSAKRMFDSASGQVRGGDSILLRLH